MLKIYPKYDEVFKCVRNLAANIAKALNVYTKIRNLTTHYFEGFNKCITNFFTNTAKQAIRYNRLLGMRYYLSITWHPPPREMWRYLFCLRRALLWQTLVGEDICREIMFFSLRSESSEVL